MNVRHQHAHCIPIHSGVHAYMYRVHTPNYPKGPALIRRPTWSPPLVVVRRALIRMARGEKRRENETRPNPTSPPSCPGYKRVLPVEEIMLHVRGCGYHTIRIFNTTPPHHHHSSCTPYNSDSASGSSWMYAAKSKSSKQTQVTLFFRLPSTNNNWTCSAANTTSVTTTATEYVHK